MDTSTTTPVVLCKCGCKRPAPIAKRTRNTIGHSKGQPIDFIHGHHPQGTRQTGPWKKDRVRVEDRGYATPCHIWQLFCSPKGYGMEWDSRLQRMNFAHRVAYEREHGPIPDGLEVDHLCNQRDCVNPDHLEAVTHRENIIRAWAA